MGAQDPFITLLCTYYTHSRDHPEHCLKCAGARCEPFCPHLPLALGADPYALGCRLKRRVQAAEVVGPGTGATGL